MRVGLLLLVFSAACTDGAVDGAKPADPATTPAPQMVVDPGFLEFDTIAAGESTSLTFDIRNEGDLALEVTGVSLAAGAESFAILSTETTGTVEPGESLTIEVAYAGVSSSDTGSIVVTGDDPENPEEEVSLTGVALLPVLAVEPDGYDYGSVGIGCLTGKILTLSNPGAASLVIDEVEVVGDGFSLPDIPDLPLTLAAGESAFLPVLFQPEAVGEASGEIRISTNDASGGAQVHQTATVIDDSCSELVVREGTSASVDVALDAEPQAAGITFLIETSAATADLHAYFEGELASIVDELRRDFADASFGVATFEDYAYDPYGADGDLPFRIRSPQTLDDDLIASAIGGMQLHDGGDEASSAIEALHQALAGEGYDQGCDGQYNPEQDVPPFVADVDDVYGGAQVGVYDPSVPGAGTLGGMGYREGRFPILVYFTSGAMRDADAPTVFGTPGGCDDAGMGDVVSAAETLGARMLAVGVDVEEGDEAWLQMADLALRTGSKIATSDGASTGAAVLRWSSDGSTGNLRQQLRAAANELVGATRFQSVTLVASDDTLGLVDAIAPESYTDVGTGDTLQFTLTVDESLPDRTYDQANQVTLQLVADGAIVLTSYKITIVRPAE